MSKKTVKRLAIVTIVVGSYFVIRAIPNFLNIEPNPEDVITPYTNKYAIVGLSLIAIGIIIVFVNSRRKGPTH